MIFRFSFFYVIHILCFMLLDETRPRLTKETAFVLGMFILLDFLFTVLFVLTKDCKEQNSCVNEDLCNPGFINNTSLTVCIR